MIICAVSGYLTDLWDTGSHELIRRLIFICLLQAAFGKLLPEVAEIFNNRSRFRKPYRPKTYRRYVPIPSLQFNQKYGQSGRRFYRTTLCVARTVKMSAIRPCICPSFANDQMFCQTVKSHRQNSFPIDNSINFPSFYDRTWSRLCYSVASVVVCLSVRNVLAKRCVLEQKLLLTTYRKSHIGNRLLPKWMTLSFV